MTKAQLKKIYSGKSRKEAIRLFCMECMGYDGHRKKGKSYIASKIANREIELCPSIKCPLYSYRLEEETPVKIDWL